MMWPLFEWPLIREPWPRHLTRAMRDELVQQFRVSAELANELRYVERQGQFAGRDVRHVRVFDPALARRDLHGIKHYEQAEGDCVLFEGYLETKGTPRLRDVRKGAAV